MNGRDRPGRKKFPPRGGFTLVEVMLIMLIMGVIAGIATPPLFRFLQSNNLQTSTDRMMADLQFARTVAITNGQVLRFNATPAGYQVIEPLSGSVLRDQNFTGGLALAANATADFFPWGMANATVFNLTNSAGTKQVNLLPTGQVEVH